MSKGKSNTAAEAKKDPTDEAPEGYVTMYGSEDCGGITIEGEPYEVVDGVAYIAHEHVEEARIHGFSTKQPK